MSPELTIVIPVYGALDQTRRALEAVRETVPSTVGVVVVNDATPIPGFGPALESDAKEKGFRYVENERNLGFVGTCNRAFAEISSGDVLLLNSDTQPTGDWLASLRAAIAPDVASVMPTSNNATIYSVPHENFNGFTQDLDVAIVGAAVESLGLGPIEIPLSVGFCMLMTRRALATVGGFDPVFGRGYGEEEDWCFRALRAGFSHLLARGAFVYHEGGVSMAAAGVLERGQTTHAGNAAILAARYPEREKLVSDFVAQPAMASLRHEVTKELLVRLRGARTKVMHWLHADPWSPQAGGTERVVRALVKGLEASIFQTVVFPVDETTLRVLERANGLQFAHELAIEVSAGAALPAWKRVASQLLRVEAVDIMHFHHGYQTGGFAPALGAVHAKVPLVVTIHDFNAVCPRNHLLDRWGAYCGVPSAGVCDACVPDLPISVSQWRSDSEMVLARADRVIVSDRSTLELIGRAIEVPTDDKIVELPPPSSSAARVSPIDHDRSPTGRVLLPGRTEADHKGRIVLGELVDRLVSHGLEVHTIGSVHDRSDDVVIHGEYESHELDGLLGEIDPDIAILPSVVPETFSLMLSELWKARIPVVALDAGAVSSRVRETGGGFLVSSGTAGDFADATLKAMSSPDEIAMSRRRLMLADDGAAESDVIGEHLRMYQGLVGLSG